QRTVGAEQERVGVARADRPARAHPGGPVATSTPLSSISPVIRQYACGPHLYPRARMLKVLLTNDDGIDAEGLQTLRGALRALEAVQLAVIAPDGNRSATARSITFRRPLWVTEIDFGDGTVGYACDGTPVDCVRLASLGLIEGFEPDLIVSGINHGA